MKEVPNPVSPRAAQFELLLSRKVVDIECDYIAEVSYEGQQLESVNVLEGAHPRLIGQVEYNSILKSF